MADRYRLTKKQVEAFVEPGEYRDNQLIGFLVRVSIDKGVVQRTYRVRVKPKDGIRAITCTIGKHGPYTVELARDEARELIRMIKAGRKPKEEKAAEVELQEQAIQQKKLVKAFTLRAALAGYLEFKSSGDGRKQKGKLSKTTAALYKQVICKHLEDWLDKPMIEIDRDLILARYRIVSQSTVASANNTFRVLRAIFNWYIEKDQGKTLVTNPVTVLAALNQWVELEPRNEIITDLKLKTWWLAVEALDNPDQSDFLKVLLLTGLRKNELATMLWADVHFDDKFWTVRDTKNRRDHSLPFTNYVASILKRRYDQRRSDVYVFPGQVSDSHFGSVAHSQDLIEQAGVRFYPHMLRATFTSIAARELPEYIVKRFVNHHDSQNVTQHHYVILKDVEQLRAPLQSIEDFVLKHCTAGSGKKKLESSSRRSG
jgi:integrase